MAPSSVRVIDKGTPMARSPAHVLVMLGPDVPNDLVIAEGYRQPRRRIFFGLADLDIPGIR